MSRTMALFGKDTYSIAQFPLESQGNHGRRNWGKGALTFLDFEI